jgi:hypothetical protein
MNEILNDGVISSEEFKYITLLANK